MKFNFEGSIIYKVFNKIEILCNIYNSRTVVTGYYITKSETLRGNTRLVTTDGYYFVPPVASTKSKQTTSVISSILQGFRRFSNTWPERNPTTDSFSSSRTKDIFWIKWNTSFFFFLFGNKMPEGNNKERLMMIFWKKYLNEEGFVSLNEFRFRSFEGSDFK